VKTLKWKNKIFNKEKDLKLDIFGNRSPEKENHYKAKKKKIRKSFTLPIIILQVNIDQRTQIICFKIKSVRSESMQ